MTGAWEPSGGFSTVNGFVLKNRDPAVRPPDDFHITMDKNKKVAKSFGRLKQTHQPVGMCTGVTYIEPGFDSNFMESPQYASRYSWHT